MGGNRIDQLGAAAGGTVICLQALLEEMPRLHVLPQFDSLTIPDEVTVLIQGFGAVGAHSARILRDRLPEAKVIGISDADGYLYDIGGLPLDELFQRWQKDGVVTRRYFMEQMSAGKGGTLKYSTDPNDLLRESAFCLIPAAPIANYLDIDSASNPAMTVDRMGRWALSVEGANTYSPDPARKTARARMEQAVYRQRGTLIATDYLVNSGGVIFAAQEKLIQTPDELHIPEEMLGNPQAVDGWLKSHAAEFSALAEKRRVAGDAHREEALRRNMRELVDLLVDDSDMLPCHAAEKISVRRIASKESGRTAADLMEPLPTLTVDCSLQEAAAKLFEAGSPILAVVSAENEIAGVVTEWDITRATAQGVPNSTPSAKVMTHNVVTCPPDAGILDMVRLLELHKISAMPVVEGGQVRGMVSADLLAKKSLAKLLQTQT
jgi:glutamate dehydrogenase (NAD(P)+)